MHLWQRIPHSTSVTFIFEPLPSIPTFCVHEFLKQGKTFHIEIHMGTLHVILKFKLRVVYCTVMHYSEDVKENEKLVAISGQLKCSDVFSYFESSINLADIWLNFILENYPGYVLVCAICFLESFTDTESKYCP